MARKKVAATNPSGRRGERLDARAKLREEPNAAAAAVVAADPKTKPKRFRRPRQRKGCHLLNLPGELRNRIYNFAVVEDGPVIITTKGPGEPSLLKTCRKLRREAGSLYYQSNDFELCIESYNGADFVPFSQLARKLDPLGRNTNIVFVFDLVPNWNNLVAWINAVYKEDAFEPAWDKPGTFDHRVAGGASKMVRECGGWGAERRERVQKQLYEMLRGTDSEWVKRGDHVFV